MLTHCSYITPSEIIASDLSLEDKLEKILSKRYFSRVQKAACARYLLVHGVNVHARNGILLRWAAENGLIDLVRASLQRGCDIHVLKGESLIKAAANNHIKVVEFLLEHGADPSKQNFCAFRICAAFGQLSMMKFLLSYPTDVAVCNNVAIKSAYKNGQYEVVSYLARHYTNIIICKAIEMNDRFTLSILKKYINEIDYQNSDRALNMISLLKTKHYILH